MKKLALIAVVVLVGAGVAYASSLSVPWFVDKDSVVNVGVPPTVKGTEGIVYLHNNQGNVVTLSIRYFSQEGADLGPNAPNNTFTINPKATLAFRPVANDPATTATPQGQEPPSGALVPNRPMSTAIPGQDGKINGSLVVTWVGGAGDVQGIYVQVQNVDGGTTGRILQWGTLLPPGV
jgi:hypothetical protein